ncbi:MAG TPA: hypothetical protein VFJ90_00955, partial [Candidatus Didemnitutus sp.]|nr:hypothetical protein [Candidatus Didemnitutus sp.]
MTTQINPQIYSGRKYRYSRTKTPYWLVKCQIPAATADNPGATRTYSKKHPTPAAAEFDRVRLLREYGGGSVSIDELSSFEAAKRRLATCEGAGKGKSITFAIDWFIKHFKGDNVAPTVEQVVTMFRAAHVSKLRPDTQEEYERYLPVLVDRFGKEQVTGITTDMLQALVDTQGGGINHRKCLVGFFTYCSGGSKKIRSPHRWLALNPAKFISVEEDEEDTEIVILTIDEVKAAMAIALLIGDLPYWVWCLFTGMRPCETTKFWTRPGYGWNRINLAAGTIIVNSEISKTKKRRKII